MLSDRALLIGELLEKSSEIALKYYNSPGTELKEDQSVVTLADKAIEEYLVSRLEDLENDVFGSVHQSHHCQYHHKLLK